MAYLFHAEVSDLRYSASVVWEDEKGRWKDDKIGGTPIVAQLAPTTGYLRKKKKNVPAIIPNGMVFVVSSRVREIVEELELGVHQFLPVKIRNGKRGEEIVPPYHILRILRKIDGVDVERSRSLSYSPQLGKRPPARMAWHGRTNPPHIVVNEEEIRDAHLWVDPWIPAIWFMSNELHDRLAEIRARGISFIVRTESPVG